MTILMIFGQNLPLGKAIDLFISYHSTTDRVLFIFTKSLVG